MRRAHRDQRQGWEGAGRGGRVFLTLIVIVMRLPLSLHTREGGGGRGVSRWGLVCSLTFHLASARKSRALTFFSLFYTPLPPLTAASSRRCKGTLCTPCLTLIPLSLDPSPHPHAPPPHLVSPSHNDRPLKAALRLAPHHITSPYPTPLHPPPPTASTPARANPHDV